MSLKCQCLTAKGTQCSRNASKSYNYCYQHKNCEDFYNKKVDRYYYLLHLFRSNPSMELMRQIDELAKEIENFD